ncbi:MAG: UDP-glucose 4-epimerase GalE [Saprospiraceae bacterium]
MNKPKILVTGGCGYIGSHTIVDLLDSGYDVVSLDNFVNSSPSALKGIEAITGKKIENINCDLSDTSDAIGRTRQFGPFDGIIHFAALKSVEESVRQPNRYIQNNLGSTLTTIEMMEELNIPHLIFSSSCTVYGSPDKLPVTENTPIKRAENPYGATKQASEILYEQYVKYQSLQSTPEESVKSGQSVVKSAVKSVVSLRYFNPAGAHTSALLGESSLNAPTNLVPVITETAIGLRDQLMVYGDDYPTRDGSCIRDYIHVMDLARAHTLALEHIMLHKQTEPYQVYNLGIGEGVTVLEAIHAFEDATGVKVNYKIGPRRAGDVAAIYADNNLITQQLHWKPALDINAIMSSAWEWEKAKRK